MPESRPARQPGRWKDKVWISPDFDAPDPALEAAFDGGHTRMISLDNQIACIRREISLRKNVYPRLLQSGKMTQAWADYQLAAIEAVLDTLEQLQDAEAHAEQAELFPASGKDAYATGTHDV